MANKNSGSSKSQLPKRLRLKAAAASTTSPSSNKASTEAEVTSRPYLPKRQRRMIALDRIHPAMMNQLKLRFFCDDCSHYSSTQKFCTLGYRAQHTRDEQMVIYERTGMIALCRALEID